MADIKELLGKTCTSVVNSEDERIAFITDVGPDYVMYHDQDCCESVYVEDIVGELADLVGSPILVAEEVSSEDYPSKEGHSEEEQWTFYKLATIKGSVTIRWYGESNYYSTSVSFKEL